MARGRPLSEAVSDRTAPPSLVTPERDRSKCWLNPSCGSFGNQKARHTPPME